MGLSLGIVGATGAVGKEILKVIEERKFPFTELYLLASKRSAGTKISFMGKEYTVEETTEDSFDKLDMALFAGGPASRAFGRKAQEKGVIVIDNSSTFRMDKDVPLIVPEVNPEDISWHKGLIANPNCSTIIMTVPLKPIYDRYGIRRIIVSTYQAVSGAGKEAIDELREQTEAVLSGREKEPEVFPHQIAFNLIPHIDVWVDDGYTKEEMKMVNETRKMFHDDNLGITATTVRVPVFRSHSESVYIETEKKADPEELKKLFAEAPGVILEDCPEENIYPMPVNASGRDEVFVGRIRRDLINGNGINLWIASDQLRKGAATNAVQIAELIVEKNLI